MGFKRARIWAVTVTFRRSPRAEPSVMDYLAGAFLEDEALVAVRLRLGLEDDDGRLELSARRAPELDRLLAIGEGQVIPLHDFEEFRSDTD